MKPYTNYWPDQESAPKAYLNFCQISTMETSFLGTVNGFDRLTIFVINFIMDLHRDLKCVYCWMPQMFDVVWSCSRGIFPILVVVWFAFSNLFYFFICCFVVNLSKSKLNILKLYTYLFKQTLLAVRTLTFSFAVFDFKHSYRDRKTLAQ